MAVRDLFFFFRYRYRFLPTPLLRIRCFAISMVAQLLYTLLKFDTAFMYEKEKPEVNSFYLPSISHSL